MPVLERRVSISDAVTRLRALFPSFGCRRTRTQLGLGDRRRGRYKEACDHLGLSYEAVLDQARREKQVEVDLRRELGLGGESC